MTNAVICPPSPGEIIHVLNFPFQENFRLSKHRFALVVGRAHDAIIARGIYTNPRRGYARLLAWPETGLRWDGFLGNWLARLAPDQITKIVGAVPSGYDPYRDLRVRV